MTGAAARAVAPRPGHRVETDIWSLICWAFQTECASLDFDEYHSAAGERGGVDTIWLMMQRGALGCQVDGGGSSDPHHDADVVASAVAALPVGCGGRGMAVWIAGLARAGKVPDWMPNAVPRLVPVESTVNQFGRMAKTADAAMLGGLGWPAVTRINRRGRTVREPVLYCPTRWSPSASRIAAARRDYHAWWGALLETRVNLKNNSALSGFVVTDEMPPLSPWEKRS